MQEERGGGVILMILKIEKEAKIEKCKQPLEAEKGKETDSLGACKKDSCENTLISGQ